MTDKTTVKNLIERISDERIQNDNRIKLLQERHDNQVYLLEDKLRFSYFCVVFLLVNLFLSLLITDADYTAFIDFIMRKINW